MLKFIDFQAKDALKKCKKRSFAPTNELPAAVEAPAKFEETSSDFIARTKVVQFTETNQKGEVEVGNIARPKSSKSKVRSFKYKWIDLKPKQKVKSMKMKRKRAKSVPIVRKNIERIVLMDMPSKTASKNNTKKSNAQSLKIDLQPFTTSKSTRKTGNFANKEESAVPLYSEKSQRPTSTAVRQRRVDDCMPFVEFDSKQFNKTRKMTKTKTCVVRAQPKINREEKAVIVEFLADLPRDEGMDEASTNATLISMDQLFTMSADKILQIPYLKVI